MRVSSVNEAWEVVGSIFQCDYCQDTAASQRAGYPVYRSEASEAWISDLGSRIEVNYEDGRTINVWIDEETQETQEAKETQKAQEVRTEKTLSIDFETEKRTGDETTKTAIAARLTLGKDTNISDVLYFQKTAEKAVKAAAKACRAGQWFTLTICEGKYRWTGDRLETIDFNSWEAVPVSSQSTDGDSVYLRPDTRYTPEHMDAILRPGHVFQDLAEYIG